VGTRRSFEDAYAAHEPAVRAFVLRRLGGSGADDVVSEVFLAAWRRLDELPTDPLPWLLSIARGVVSNRRRADRRGVALAERLAREPVGVATEPDGDLDVALLDALGSLSDDDRELLLLAVWDELSHAQLAAALGVPRGTVAVRLHRARRRLARAVEARPPAEQPRAPVGIETGGGLR